MNKRGPKVKEYPKEEIDYILYKYTSTHTGWIKYSDVYKFANQLYINHEIEDKLSEDFWRKKTRQGKIAIDEINKLYLSTIEIKKNDAEYYVNTELYIDKILKANNNERKILIDALKVNEKKAKEYVKLVNKITELEKELEVLKNKLTEENLKANEYRKILFSWFSSSNRRDIHLENLITTGKAKSPLVDMFFETMFSEPAEAYNKIKDFVSNKGEKENKVIPIKKSKIQEIIDRHTIE